MDALFSDGDNIIEELDATGTATARYAQALGIDEPLAEYRLGATSYYEADGLGSVTSLTSSVGAVAKTYLYDSFGNDYRTTGTLTNPYQFTAREFDSETGLYYYRARYYDPTVGRFLSEDPLHFDGPSTDFYPYTANSPPNLIDPDGLTWQTNWNFFWDWALGRGPRQREYGPDAVETQEMANSIAAEQMREAFYRGNCHSIVKKLGYATVQAYEDTVANPSTADWSSTAAQVGGFSGASAINNGDGTITFIIPNVAGTHSFFLHLIPDRTSPKGPMSNIRQTFRWTEPIVQGLGGCSCR